MPHPPRPARPSRLVGPLLGALLTAVGLALLPAVPAVAASDTATATTAPEPAPSPTPAGSTLTLSASTTSVVYGVRLGLVGALTDGAGAAVPGAQLSVYSRTQGQDGRVLVATVTTNEYGRAQALLVPRTSAEYEMRFAGDGAVPPARSNPVASNVQPRLQAAFTPAGIRLGQGTVLTGSLAPAYAGVPVDLLRRGADGRYTRVRSLPVAGDGGFRLPLTPGVVGTSVWRVALPAAPPYLLAYTAPLTLQVDPRALRLGDRGGDVASLERRLAAQRADVGRVDGVFDADLLHALITFQKAQGLPRTGVYDQVTSARLAAPRPVRLRFPAAGRAVEVNLRQQVLYLSEGGVLRRMVDVSSGTDRPYVSEGRREIAFTPVGSFRVERKVNGIRISPLGELYRPAYFVSGWAIHGSPSVPAYPASHGCIRVTNSVQDRLYPLLTIGTPVHVYRG